jgi:hypothetical protein
MPGAITFLHEAGSALNLNPHPHSLIPDGVFAGEPEQPAFFLELPPPTHAQVEHLLATIARRVRRALERSGQTRGDDDPEDGVIPVDAREARAYAAWHRSGAPSMPFDYLEPTSPEVIRKVLSTRARQVIVYGDGGDPDSGEQLAQELSGKGLLRSVDQCEERDPGTPVRLADQALAACRTLRRR